MPTPAKTSAEAIIAAARVQLERHGESSFALSDVARAVGVRPPSLYKHFDSRDALLARLEQLGYEELGAMITRAAQTSTPLIAMAQAYRQFASSSPQLYARMLSVSATRSAESLAWRQRAVAPLLAVLSTDLPPDRVLGAARTITAFVHGFVTMEAAGAFRLGGDVDADFALGLTHVLTGIRHHSGTSRRP